MNHTAHRTNPVDSYEVLKGHAEDPVIIVAKQLARCDDGWSSNATQWDCALDGTPCPFSFFAESGELAAELIDAGFHL